MLPGIILSTIICLLVPIGGMPNSPAGHVIPTQPTGNVVRSAALRLLPPTVKDTSVLGQPVGERVKRNLDIGGVLKTLGVGLDVGGPQLGFKTPNVTVDTPIGQIGGCVTSRRRRDEGARRGQNAESLETSQERNGQADVSF